MLKQLVVSSVAGLFLLAYIIQYDSWLQQYMLDYFKTEFQQALACRISCRLDELRLFKGYMKLKQVYVTPPQGTDWHWRAKRFKIAFSWWQLLLYGSFDFSIDLEDFHAYSSIKNNELAMGHHLYLALKGPQLDIYTFLKELTFTNATCTIRDEAKKIEQVIAWDSQTKKIDNVFKATIDLYNGKLFARDCTLFQHMSGSLQLDSFDGQPHIDMCLRGAASIEIPQLGKTTTPCYISCSWQHNRGQINLKNIDHSFVIDPIIIKSDGYGFETSIEANVPLGYVWHMLTNENDDERLSGSCSVQVKIDTTNEQQTAHGHIIAQRMKWQEAELGSLAKITFNKKNNEDTYQGSLYIQRTSGACASGEWQWLPQTGQVHAYMNNNARLTFSPKHDWQILPEDLHVEITTDKNGACTIVYNGKATHAKVYNRISSSGSVTLQDNKIEAQGKFDDNTYKLKAFNEPFFYIQSFDYTNPEQIDFIKLSGNDQQQYKGYINVGCIKEVLKKRCNFDLQGEGLINVTIDKNQDSYQAQVHLHNGAIRLPRTFNFINGFDCSCIIDLQQKKCTVNDFSCTLHNGRITSKVMHLRLSDDLYPRFMYAPLLVERCLLNMGKELFAIVSGDLLLSKKEDVGTQLTGKLFLDRSQLKENLFSDVFQKNMRAYTAYSFETERNDLMCDLVIKTKYPVRVHTPFLQTDARIDLAIKQQVRDPQVTGTIELDTGQLNFPYKPLYITKGALHFLPGKLDDPLIELVAKNIIKKNNITMHVSGSLQNQHVTLESSPPLTEEQIVSLLLVGSQEESLNMVMPALLMQNIKAILFGYDQTTTTMSRYFGNLLKPFGRIHLVPSFIDQSGRGGLRGAIEIDIGDRWRAIIQKNFSLTEDTRFELEYLLSDDMSIRATRDIRRDLIGEVEMRWKFGKQEQ